MLGIGPTTKKFMRNFLSNKLKGTTYPFFGSVEITRRCNSKCSFCPIGNEKAEIKKGEMGAEEMKKVFDQFNELNIIAVSFLGGEPFLHKEVFDVADYSRTIGIISQVSTNGLTLDATAERATEAFDVIVVSLDTLDPELYRDIRGVDAYDKVVRGIKRAIELSPENKCNVLLNTVVCAKNIPEIPDVVKFGKEVGAKGVMIDFATFHDYWTDTVTDNSRYNPAEMDWRNDREGVRKLVRELIKMKKDYPIVTSSSYLKTFITENFNYTCYPYLFCCVRKTGHVAIPCWDSKVTKFYDILGEYNLKELWFSDEVKNLREKVKNCKDCYMHCIVEPSKVLGAPSRNMIDLMEWIATFRKNRYS
ncbi:MAG: radical SAM protein [Thermoplasmata archaeon]|nr:MAG: radical SAM protein [Thermoplasmata archaeon]